jgi:hypothetical protein
VADASGDATAAPEVPDDADAAADAAKPELLSTPSTLDFGAVDPGTAVQGRVTLSVVGDGVIHIHEIEVSGSGAFSVMAGGKVYAVTLPSAVSEPLAISPEDSLDIDVLFLPEVTGPFSATAILRTTAGSTKLVLSGLGAAQGPCLHVDPEQVKLPTTAVGDTAVSDVTVTNCGDPTAVTPEIGPGSHPGFALIESAKVPLETGAQATIQVRFAPESLEEEPYEPAEGTLLLQPTVGTPLAVPLRSGVVQGTEPVAVIDVAEGDTVLADSLLHVSGARSWAPGGVDSYVWSVEAPDPYAAPNVDVPWANLVVAPSALGTWTFRLRVVGADGSESAEATRTVQVHQPGIRVELTWYTPADPDRTDTIGTNLDLHLVHPYASGPDIDGDGAPDGWYDQPFDCFWFNPSPNWGSFDPAVADDPHLSVDDTDGGGPEIITLRIPETDKTYRVGVAAYGDAKLGVTFATVRIYVDGLLAYEEPDVALLPWDLWEVARIHWPVGGVEAVRTEDGERLILPDYHNPFFR